MLELVWPTGTRQVIEVLVAPMLARNFFLLEIFFSS